MIVPVKSLSEFTVEEGCSAALRETCSTTTVDTSSSLTCACSICTNYPSPPNPSPNNTSTDLHWDNLKSQLSLGRSTPSFYTLDTFYTVDSSLMVTPIERYSFYGMEVRQSSGLWVSEVGQPFPPRCVDEFSIILEQQPKQLFSCFRPIRGSIAEFFRALRAYFKTRRNSS